MGRKRQTMGTGKYHSHPHAKYGCPPNLDASEKFPTKNQKDVLRRHQLPIPYRRDYATEVISALADNGWQSNDRIWRLAKQRKQDVKPKKREAPAPRSFEQCDAKTKSGKPCNVPADRHHNGRAYCHIHDPEGEYQRQRRAGTAGKPGAGHERLDRELDAVLDKD